jgi:hypothetical protein
MAQKETFLKILKNDFDLESFFTTENSINVDLDKYTDPKPDYKYSTVCFGSVMKCAQYIYTWKE